MSTTRRKERRRRRRRGFVPPHCPNRGCPFYVPSPDWRFARHGIYTRPSDGKSFQRFRCCACRRSFSTRTFAANYWLQHRHLLLPIARLSTEGPGLRQIGRVLGVAHATVGRHLARAGRLCLLLQQETLGNGKISEPLVVDGFETFEYSQYFPFHLNLAVGAESWMLYSFTDSPLRGKGKMTPTQKRRRAQLEATLGRPDPKAVENGMVELLRPLLSRPAEEATHGPTVILHSDDHPAYRRSLRRLREDPSVPRIRHEVTSSLERRTTSNPLFPVNLADLLLRHSQAAYRRGTIAFCKRRQGTIERMAVFQVWRNAIKNRREKAPGTTAAMAAGFLDRPWRWTDVFRRRRFPRRAMLPGPWWDYYWRRIQTLAFGSGQTGHARTYAF